MDMLLLTKLMSLAFFAILFLQSGLDKVLDYRTNVTWMTEHFAKSPLHGTVGILLPILTVLEVSAGVLCALGGGLLVLYNSTTIAEYGMVLCGISFLALFFGQRISKNYPGALSIATYFAVYLIAFAILQLN